MFLGVILDKKMTWEKHSYLHSRNLTRKNIGLIDNAKPVL